MKRKEIPDFEFEDSLASQTEVLHRREFKSATGPSFDFTMNATVADGKERVDTYHADIKATFRQNLKYWNNQTQFMSSNDFRNSYYRGIVDMGIDAVPYIFEEISRHPSFLVHALDEILPGIVNYGDGYVPVEKACDTWISILKTIEKN